MADKNFELGLRIKADLNQAKTALMSLENGLDKVDLSGKKAGRGGLTNASNSAARLRKEASELPALLTRIAGLLGAAFSVREVAQAAESYTLIKNRLSLVTSGSEELAQAQDAVFAAAQSARQPLSATAELYQRIATNADALKLSADGVASVVDVINKTLAISGTSGASSAAALTQLGQAFASGTLRGEELNSVLEQAPALAKTLADGLGVTVGQLRALGEEGKLSAQNVIQALQSQADSVEEQFSKIQITGGQALTVLANSLTRVMGELDLATGSSAAFAGMIENIAKWLDSGELTSGLVESLSIWGSVFESIGSDIDSLAGDLEGLELAADSTLVFLIDAFKKLPVNVRAAVQIATVEILALIDRLVAYAEYGAAAVKAAFSSSTLDDASNDLEQRLNRISELRRDSISDIIGERDAVLETAKAERERGEQERKNREEARREREKNIAALRQAAKSAPIELGGDEKAKKEKDKQAARDSKALSELNIQLLRAQGKVQEATQAEFENKYGEMLKRLKAQGNDAGAKIIEELINLRTLDAQLSEMEKKFNDSLNNISRQENSIDAQREAGLISEYEARQQIYDLHQKQAQKLEEMRPMLEELSKKPGQVGVAATESLAALDDEILRLNSTMTLLQSTLRDGLESGLKDAITGLADGTKSFGDAVRSVGAAVADALANMAANALAQQLAGGMMSGGAGLLTAFFADGGHVTGPGTETSDSIPAMLSNNEFVTRAAVVKQPGALDFLTDFNRRGLNALRDWAPARHSTGGLAGVPAPSMPSPTLGNSSLAEPAKAFSATVPVNQTFNLIDDPARIAEAFLSKEGEENFAVMISRNPGKFRQLLGVNN